MRDNTLTILGSIANRVQSSTKLSLIVAKKHTFGTAHPTLRKTPTKWQTLYTAGRPLVQRAVTVIVASV